MRRIKSLPLSLRPREKLLKYGAEALTVEELFSVILITGTKNAPVSQLVNKVTKLLKKDALSKNSLHLSGFGPTKIAQIVAVLELSKRLHIKNQTVTITKAAQVFALSTDIIHENKESLMCLYLNARGELLKKEVMAVGSLNKVNVLPREIFSVVKDLPVASIILVHNHPSGILEASEEDLLFTKRVKLAGDILGVKLLDHLIVSPQGWKKIPI